MSEIKVRLSMVIPGATMLSTQDCVKMSKKEAYNHSTMMVVSQKKKGKKVLKEKELITINTRKSKPARQCISITKESYNYMIDAMEVPVGMNKVWKNMSSIKRLEYHLSDIASHFNAYSYSYEVLDD